MGMGAGKGPWCVQGEVKRLKVRKAPGIDGITAEMLKYGGDAVVEWMLLICNLAWKRSCVRGMDESHCYSHL